ncbi:MYOSIN HEAVY CHAIN-LIKE PROTEIN [Salix purpurea]|uniref:MYOSIN HEAVY CHAIN-LIKE PROTEIN n=1 Tax=Salix purpurea TaxID=77065 RepID=A0A9Q0QFL9_SALPP|nr:MYOSIN HEAVY CHAIN-LIKE PROTEIN [Salix purpurea]
MELAGSHGDPENVEQMEETKRDIEHKVGKILKLIQNNGPAKKGKIPEDSKKRSALIELVEDFHEQYQSLYAQYDYLRAELGKKAPGRKEKESSPSSSFSDSDYYSPDIGGSPMIDILLETSDGTAGELDSANLEVSGLKHRLASATSENEALHAKYSAALQEADNVNKQNRELSALMKVHELHESQASAQIKELEGQLTALKTEMDSLYTLKKDFELKIENKTAEAQHFQEKILTAAFTKRKEASAQAKGLKNRINNLQKELDSLRCEKSQLEAQLNMKTKEVAENLLRTETLEGEITRKAITEQELLKEKETFHAQRKDLELEADSIRNQKNRLEELIRSKNQETDQLRQEGERMHARIFELEGILLDRGNSFSPCQKEFESRENEATTQIMALKSQVFSLQQDLDSLLSEKSLLETQNERLRRDVMQIQFQMENEVQNLTSEIEEQQKILKDKEDTIKRLTEETKVVRHRSLDSPKYRSLDSPKYRSLDSPRTNPQSLERKIEELAGSFHMKMENHIRILYQRILVAEQIHAETKDSYKKMKDRLDQENIELIEKTTAFEAEFRKIREMLLETGEIFSGAETALKKFYEDNENLSDPIGRISNELQFAKRWITETRDEIKKLKHNVDSLTLQLNGKEEKEFLLREKVWKLEATLSKEGGEKLNSVSQLERKVVYLEQQVKQQEDILLGVSEEKREAIRQLCMMVDYHRGRYDHLREAISKKTVHIRRMA